MSWEYDLQHGTFRHEDLLEFVSRFVKEGEDRRVSDEAFAKNPDSKGLLSKGTAHHPTFVSNALQCPTHGDSP